MKAIILLITVSLGLGNLSFADEPAATRYTFATTKQSRDILTADDNYMNRMSVAEIAIRTSSVTADKTAEDLKALYAANILEWTEAEKAQITELVAANKARLATIQHLLPAEITFIKVNNKVEGGLPHTRGHGIILPISAEGPSGSTLSEELFYHELFHILSRMQKNTHHELYGLIGFKPCHYSGNDDVNTNIRSNIRALTNPDVPAESYYLPVSLEGVPSAIMPFLHTTRSAFDPTIQGGFRGHFRFGLLKVTVTDGQCIVDRDSEDNIEILDPPHVKDFFTAIGKNTAYIIHPEEILAENFVFIMTGKTDLPNPEIPYRLKTWLTKNKKEKSF